MQNNDIVSDLLSRQSRKRPHAADPASPFGSSRKRTTRSTAAGNSRAFTVSSMPGAHYDRLHVTGQASRIICRRTLIDLKAKTYPYFFLHWRRQFSLTDEPTRQAMNQTLWNNEITEYQKLSPFCLKSLAHRETWIIQLIINQCMKDIQTAKDPKLLILSKNRAAQIRDILPDHPYLADYLVDCVSEISDPIIVKQVINVSSLIKNQMSPIKYNFIADYYKSKEMKLTWDSKPKSSTMKPYFDNPVISYFVQNRLLQRNAPIDFIGSYSADGCRIDGSTPALVPQGHISIAYNGKLHVVLNVTTRSLTVSIHQVNGSHSISCKILTPMAIQWQFNFNLMVSISPNNQWVIIHSSPRYSSCWVYLYEYQQHKKGSAASFKDKKINLDGFLSDSHGICNIQFTKDSEILVISTQLKESSSKKSLIIKSTDSFSNNKARRLENHTIVTIEHDYILTRKREAPREDLSDTQPKITLYKWDIQSIQDAPPTQQIIQIPQSSPLPDNYGIIWTPNFLFLTQYYYDYSMPVSSFKAKIFIFKYEKNYETRTNEYQYKHTYQTNHINYLFISDTGNTIISNLSDEPVKGLQIHVLNHDKSAYDQVDTSSLILQHTVSEHDTILSTLDEKFFIVQPCYHTEISAFTLNPTPDNIGRAVSNTGALKSDASLSLKEKHGIMTSPLVCSYREWSSAHGSALEQGPEFIDVLYKQLNMIGRKQASARCFEVSN